MGFIVHLPAEDETAIDDIALNKQELINMKQGYIDQHIDKIKASDAILIANYSLNDKEDYIGANTFLEMGFAYLLKTPIFILNSIPNQSNSIEIEGLKPLVLNCNLNGLIESMT